MLTAVKMALMKDSSLRFCRASVLRLESRKLWLILNSSTLETA